MTAIVTNADATVDGNRVFDSEAGIQVYHRGVVTNNLVMGSLSWGLVNYGFDTLVRRNLFQGNGGGVDSVGSATLCANAFVDNTVQARRSGERNSWACDERGNYWSDYHGTDGNGDGIGDSWYTGIEGGDRDEHPLMSSPFGPRRASGVLPARH